MVLDVSRSKLDGRRSYCHGAKDKQDSLHDRMSPEAAMSQHAMEASSQAERGESVHRYQEYQVGQANCPLPKRAYCQDSAEEGNDHNHKDKRFGIRRRSHTTSIKVELA